MSTSKHIDKICLAAIAVILVIAVLVMSIPAAGTSEGGHSYAYEELLFDTGKVHSINITVDDWDGFLQNCENEEYISCKVTIDSEAFSNVALRAKGNTSLSSVSSMGSSRYSFKLEFDHYQDGMTYHGLDKLCLNNLIQDNTMMKDYLVYQLMDSFGVESPLSSYVYITVNGEDWGLYLAVEAVEDSFLSRNYGSDTGELYKPDSMSFGAGRGNGKDFNMDDFTQDTSSSDEQTEGTDNTQSGFMGMPGGDSGFGNIPDTGSFSPSDMPEGSDFSFSDMPDTDSFDFSSIGNIFSGMGSDDVKLKYSDDSFSSYSNIFNNAKTDITSADKKRLISSLKNLTEYTDLENTVNIDEVIRYFVIHNFVVNGDSYTGSMIHNYYLHENDGQLSMIPWDYNLAFGTFMGGSASSSVNDDIDNPVSNGSVDDRPMVGWIFSDEAYTEQYHKLFSQFIEEWIDSGKLEQLIRDTADMIRPYVESDPTKFCTSEEFETGVDAISQFVALRGEAVSRQLSGDTTPVDAGDLNTSDMGSMGGTMGGGGFGGMTKPDSFSPSSGTDASSSSDDSSFSQPPSGSDSSSGMQPPSGSGSFSDMQPPSGSDGSSGMQPPSGSDSSSGMQPPSGSGGFSGMQPPSGSDSSSGMQPPSGFSGFSGTQEGGSSFPGTVPSSSAFSSTAETIILLSVSVVILLIGLLIAYKKKY